MSQFPSLNRGSRRVVFLFRDAAAHGDRRVREDGEDLGGVHRGLFLLRGAGNVADQPRDRALRRAARARMLRVRCKGCAGSHRVSHRCTVCALVSMLRRGAHGHRSQEGTCARRRRRSLDRLGAPEAPDGRRLRRRRRERRRGRPFRRHRTRAGCHRLRREDAEHGRHRAPAEAARDPSRICP